ncbi:MAG: KH domain-containing protein [Atopobiaceae bacterium]|nr:KH domain-containing protein [Atopobiaceae bacterium]
MHDVEESIDTIDAESQNYDSESVLPSDKVADLVELIVCGLVADPEAVSLDVSDGDDGALIEISCAEQDAGKVIGRRGRTIKAIRTIARACGQRVGTAVEVEVLG